MRPATTRRKPAAQCEPNSQADADTAMPNDERPNTKLKDGKEQLRSHTHATGAPIALWSNGAQTIAWHRKNPNYFVDSLNCRRRVRPSTTLQGVRPTGRRGLRCDTRRCDPISGRAASRHRTS